MTPTDFIIAFVIIAVLAFFWMGHAFAKYWPQRKQRPVIAFIFITVDVLWNLTAGTIWFLDLPREFTLSGRIARLANTDTGWRGDRAYEMYLKYIHAIDPGHEGVKYRG